MRMRRTWVKLVATLVVGVTVAAGPAAPAEAGSCTSRPSATHTDWLGTVYRGDWVCGNASPATVYAGPDYGYVVGWLDSRRSWFVCWKIGALHGGGNRVWYRTQGDRVQTGWESLRGWGYVPAVNVLTSTDPWPGMRAC